VVNAIRITSRITRTRRQGIHIVDPAPMRVGDVLNTFASADHAPAVTLRLMFPALFRIVPRSPA